MLALTVQRSLWAFVSFISGVVACADYDYMEKYLLRPDQGSNDTGSIDKRWYTVSSDESDTPLLTLSVWPSSTLPYCWENDAAKTALELVLRDGWELWQAAGVSYNTDMGVYSDCPSIGADGSRPPSSRSEYLLIKYNTNGVLRTTLGYGLYATGRGPFLDMDPTSTLAMGNAAANMAHEIGHAWGFFHEHQRQSFWAKGEVEMGTGAHNQINFNCANIKGYAELLEKWGVTKMNAACKSYSASKQLGFNAVEYLPFSHQYSKDMGAGVFDWKSIMLYGSKIGGVVSGGETQNVYTKASDSSVVAFNKVPSQRDVQRFKSMYSQPAPNPNPCLINQGCSSFRAAFLRTKASCKKLVN